MGYSHYWQSQDAATDKQSEQVQAAALHIVAMCNVPLIGFDETESPVISDQEIAFNGLYGHGYETITIDLQNAMPGFNFCKTEHMAYDVAVVAMLRVCSIIIPSFNWKSDGNNDELAPGISLGDRALAHTQPAKDRIIKLTGEYPDIPFA